MTRYNALQRYSVALHRLARARRRAARRGATPADASALRVAEAAATQARRAALRESARDPRQAPHV